MKTYKQHIRYLKIKLLVHLIALIFIIFGVSLPTIIYRLKHPEKTGTQIFLHTFKTIQ